MKSIGMLGMGGMAKIGIFFTIFLSAFILMVHMPFVESDDISNCINLDSADTIYYLTGDIVNHTVTVCINITAQNVTLDCQGYSIIGSRASTTYGIMIRGAPYNGHNATVKNCIISNWTYAINPSDSYENNITNNTVNQTSGAFYSYYGKRSHIDNNTFTADDYGILMSTSAEDNWIYNNTVWSGQYGVYSSVSDGNAYWHNRIQGNTNAILITGSNANGVSVYNNIINGSISLDSTVQKWNTTNQTGDNVYNISAGIIGGNYWTNSTANGFSDTCANADGDTYCDYAYNLTTKTACTIGVNCTRDVDYLPYANTAPESSNESEITGCTNLNVSGENYVMTSDIFTNTSLETETYCINITADNITFDCAGYLIEGNGSYLQNDNGAGRAVGINIFNVTNITVENCRITNFSQAVYAENISDSILSNMTIYSRSTTPKIDYGLKLWNYCTNNSVYDWSIDDVEIGIGIYHNCTLNDFWNINVTDSTASAHYMLSYGWGSSNNTMTNVSVNNSYSCMILYDDCNYNIFDNVNCTGMIDNGLDINTGATTASSSNYNNFTSFIVRNSGDYGISFGDSSNHNRFVGGSVNGNEIDFITVGYSSESDTNVFYGMNFTGNVNISWCSAVNSYCNGTFTMSNTTSGEITLKTRAENQSAIVGTYLRSQRNISSWSQTRIEWNDRNLSCDTLYNYTLTGLLVYANYSVYNNTGLSYALTTDASGNLGPFTVVSETSGNNITVLNTTGENGEVPSETTAPKWQNANSTNASIAVGLSTVLYAEGWDETGLKNAWYATNESGAWVNYTKLVTTVWTHIASGAYIVTEIDIGNVLSDYGNEVAFDNYYNNNVTLLNSTGHKKWSTDISQAACGVGYSNWTTGVSIGDIDDDGQAEVAASADNGCAYLLNGTNGSIIWSYDANGTVDYGNNTIATEVKIGTLNNQKVLAYVGGTAEWNGGGYLIVLNSTGQKLWSYVYNECSGLNYTYDLAIGDVEGNGKGDVAFVSCNKVFVFNGTGSQLWNYTLDTNYTFGVEIGNVTNITGRVGSDVVVSTMVNPETDAKIFLLNSTGSQVWNYTVPGSNAGGGHVRIADLDNSLNGSEIIATTWNGDYILFLNSTGSQIYNYSASGGTWGLAVKSLGIDEYYEIAYGTDNDDFSIFRYNAPMNLLNKSNQWVQTNFTWSNSSFSGGTVGWRIYYKDSAGNINSTDIKTFDVSDGTAPTLTVISPTNTTYTSSSVWFNLTGSETMDTCFVDYSGSNTSLTNSSGNWNYLGTLSNAAYTAKFWCNDSVGNGNMTTVSFTVSVDSGSPGGGSSSTVPEVNETINETSENVTNPTVTLEIPGLMSVDLIVPKELVSVVGNEPLGYAMIGGTAIAELAFLMRERRKKRLNWKSYAFAGATALLAVWLIFAFAFQSPLTWETIQAHANAVRSL